MACPSGQKDTSRLKTDRKRVRTEHNGASNEYWLTKSCCLMCSLWRHSVNWQKSVDTWECWQAARDQGWSGKDGRQLERVGLSKIRGSPKKVDREKSYPCRTWIAGEAAWPERATFTARQIISSTAEGQTSSRVCLLWETCPQISWLQNSRISRWAQASAKQQTPLLQLHWDQT